MVSRSVSYADGFNGAVFLGLTGISAHMPRKTTVRERGVTVDSCLCSVLSMKVGESISLIWERKSGRQGAAAGWVGIVL